MLCGTPQTAAESIQADASTSTHRCCTLRINQKQETTKQATCPGPPNVPKKDSMVLAVYLRVWLGELWHVDQPHLGLERPNGFWLKLWPEHDLGMPKLQVAV